MRKRALFCGHVTTHRNHSLPSLCLLIDHFDSFLCWVCNLSPGIEEKHIAVQLSIVTNRFQHAEIIY